MRQLSAAAALLAVFAAAAAARDAGDDGADRAAARAAAKLHEMGATLVLRSGKTYDPKQAVLVGATDVQKVEFPRRKRIVTQEGEPQSREPVENQDLAPLRSLAAVEEIVLRDSRATDAGLARAWRI